MLLYQITRPFTYITVSNPSKRWVDIFLPLILSTTITVLCTLAKPFVNVWGYDGMVSNIQSVIQILPGFYIAALAAIVALGRNKRLDELITGNPTPVIEMYQEEYEEKTTVALTRRHFLCLLFSYLTAISLILCIASPVVIHFIPAFNQVELHSYIVVALFFFVTALFFFFISQIIFITLFGLFYIAEKMHS